MKKFFAAMLAAAILMCMSASVALAASYVYITGTVHVHSGPGVGYSEIAILKKDSTVTYMQQTRTDSSGNKWYRVSFGTNNTIGWVISKYASLTDTPGDATYGSGANAGDGTEYGFGYWNTNEVIATARVNVRSGPGLKYEILTTMHEDDTAVYLGNTSYDERGVMWYNISFDGKTGWISSTYAQLANNGTLWAMTVRIVDGTCNVRTGPGLAYKSIGNAYEDEVLSYLGNTSVDERGVAWYNVSFNGKNGWISSVYSQLENNGYLWYREVEIVEGKCNVRTGPGLSHKSLGTAYEGEILAYAGGISYDDRGVAWYSVSFEGQTGWVSSVYAEIY